MVCPAALTTSAGAGGPEVEGRATGGHGRPEQVGREGKAVTVKPAPAECRPIGHDPRPVESGQQVDKTADRKTLSAEHC